MKKKKQDKLDTVKIKAICKKYGFKDLDEAVGDLEDMSWAINETFDNVEWLGKNKKVKAILKLLKSIDSEHEKDYAFITDQWEIQEQLENVKYAEKREKEDHKRYLELKKKFEEKKNGKKD